MARRSLERARRGSFGRAKFAASDLNSGLANLAGRVTFLHGRHPSRDGGWAPVVNVTDSAFADLGEALGRPLTAEQRAAVCSLLQTVAGYLEASSGPRVKAQDVRETLRALSRLSDGDARGAYACADANTRAEVAYRLQKGAPSIQAAAEAALGALRPGARGQPIKGYQRLLVHLALRRWREWGGPSEVVYVQNRDRTDPPSPLVRWTLCLLSRIEPDPSDTQVVKLLKAEMASPAF